MKHRLLGILLAAGALVAHLPVRAADTDLFIGANAGANATLPNVILIVDNNAAFSSSADTSRCPAGTLPPAMAKTTGGVEACAIYSVINALPVNSDGTAVVNVGFMMGNSNNMQDINGVSNCGAPSSNGGCLMVPLTAMSSANKAQVLTWIMNWHTSGGAGPGYIKANTSGQTAATMQETWAYYEGNYGLSGRNYASVQPSSGCGKNFVVFVADAYGTNGTPKDNTNPSPQNNLASTGYAVPATCTSASAQAGGPGLYCAPGVTPTQLNEISGSFSITVNNSACGPNPVTQTAQIPATNPQHVSGGYFADEWAEYMNLNYTISTYTIGFLGCNWVPQYPALLTSMANVGKGKYFQTTDYSSLIAAFNTIFSEIQSVNSVFAAVSLPASATVQGTYLNQIYVGMFRPDPNGLPRWMGNLKQYQVGAGATALVDADGNNALDVTNTGFITACARSFWTPKSAHNDMYWALNPQGTCTSDPNGNPVVTAPQTVASTLAASNDPDGPTVEKGAVGYFLRGLQPLNYSNSPPVPRTLYTCSATFSSCTSRTDFNTTNVSPAALGLASTDTADQTALIDWASGANIDNELNMGSGVVRASIHGDVVHSSPLALSYGADVVVFYGDNDGWFRAINGNQGASSGSNSCPGTGCIGSVPPGGELWAFMPPEFYPNIQRIRSDTIPITYPGAPSTAQPKPYGMDGPIGAYVGTFGGGNVSWIYPAMRRGGRALYAFQVNSTVPSSTNPQLLWKKGCPDLSDNTNCTSGLSGIGQTWSMPRVIKVAGYSGPLIIMGGGYDTCEDADPNTCSATGYTVTGNKVYVLDASIGSLQVNLPTIRPVVGDVTVVPDTTVGSPTFGQAAYAYVGDLGGNIYRISGATANTPFGSTPPSAWTITQIASLGCDTVPATCSANRKFMFSPSVVPQADGSYVILIGSGDREKPVSSYTNAYGVANYFFMVKDNPTNTQWLTSESAHCGQSIICLASLVSEGSTDTGCTSPASQASLNAAKGWYLGLRPHEQVVTPAATAYGITTFSTHIPQTSGGGQVCTANLGTTHVYNLSTTSASTAAGTTCNAVVTGGGLPPAPEKKTVLICDANGNCNSEPICVGCGTGSPISPTPNVNPAPAVGSPAKHRVYWYIQQ